MGREGEVGKTAGNSVHMTAAKRVLRTINSMLKYDE